MTRALSGVGALTGFFAGRVFPAGCGLAAAFPLRFAAVGFAAAVLVWVVRFAAALLPAFLVGAAIFSPRIKHKTTDRKLPVACIAIQTRL
jgi:hypothetical protein